MSQSQDFWSDADVIYTYTRAQAIEDGLQVDVGTFARDAGFCYPLATTIAVWEKCVSRNLPDGEIDFKAGQRNLVNLLDAAYLAVRAHKRSNGTGHDVFFNFHGQRLKINVGPGDNAEPVLTIMLPDED
jgi:hypothetical protein